MTGDTRTPPDGPQDGRKTPEHACLGGCGRMIPRIWNLCMDCRKAAVKKEAELRTPQSTRQQRQTAMHADLDYVRQRQAEMRDRERREARYQPGFRVDPPARRKKSDDDA